MDYLAIHYSTTLLLHLSYWSTKQNKSTSANSTTAPNPKLHSSTSPYCLKRCNRTRSQLQLDTETVTRCSFVSIIFHQSLQNLISENVLLILFFCLSFICFKSYMSIHEALKHPRMISVQVPFYIFVFPEHCLQKSKRKYSTSTSYYHTNIATINVSPF